MSRYEKSKIAIRYQLLGFANYDPKWYVALQAFDYASELSENAFRKDGAPEFSHQMRIVSSILQVHQLIKNPEICVAVAFLHDVLEDKIVQIFPFDADTITKACNILNKNNFESSADYYNAISNDPVASIVKGFDRLDNVSTMAGAFSKEKTISYIEETVKYTLPMLKTARRSFYDQSQIYELIRDRIENIINVHKFYLIN